MYLSHALVPARSLRPLTAMFYLYCPNGEYLGLNVRVRMLISHELRVNCSWFHASKYYVYM